MTVRHAIPLACLVALAAPASAGAFQIGIQDDGAFVSTSDAERAKALDYAHTMGATYLRITVVWYQLYNNPGRARAGIWDTGLIGAEGRPSSLYRQLVAARASLAGY
jgi:hypothetical protein